MNKGRKLSRRDFLCAAGKASLGAAAACVCPAAGSGTGRMSISEANVEEKEREKGIRIAVKDHTLIIEQP